MRQLLKDLNSRDGQLSSKKLWYNLSCLTSTVVVLWACYRDSIEDFYFICLIGIYLCTVGGFEVILEILRLVKGVKNADSMVIDKLEADSSSGGSRCPDCPVVVVPDTQPKSDKGAGKR